MPTMSLFMMLLSLRRGRETDTLPRQASPSRCRGKRMWAPPVESSALAVAPSPACRRASMPGSARLDRARHARGPAQQVLAREARGLDLLEQHLQVLLRLLARLHRP